MSRPTVAALLDSLGYSAHGTEIDDTMLWMIAEITVLRDLVKGMVAQHDSDYMDAFFEAEKMYPAELKYYAYSFE